MTVTIQTEAWRDVQPEIAALLETHWTEIDAPVEGSLLLDVDWPRYDWLADHAMLSTITVRDGDVLVGYLIACIQLHPHAKTVLHAIGDAYYVDPAYRDGRIGLRLFRFAEQTWRAMGVRKYYVSSKVHAPVDAIFERLGCVRNEVVYSKLLTDRL